jgi:hypothetical protein
MRTSFFTCDELETLCKENQPAPTRKASRATFLIVKREAKRIKFPPDLALLEHRVQRLKHWPGHVPVKIVGFEVEQIGARLQPGQTWTISSLSFASIPMLIGIALVSIPIELSIA